MNDLETEARRGHIVEKVHSPIYDRAETMEGRHERLPVRTQEIIARWERGSGSIRASAMQQMQQTYGNRAVQRQVHRSQTHSSGCGCSGCSGGRAAVRGFPSGKAPGGVVQRYCGTPGCSDPGCHDERNHGFDRVRQLRGRTVYSSTVRPAELGTGTETTKETRDYVNSATIAYPEQIAMEYSSRRGRKRAGRGVTEFINAPLARGQRADAGHIIGRQNGGLGDDPAAVFPQNPQQNRGNLLKGEPTRGLWRAHEDAIHDLAEAGTDVSMAVTLRDKPRVQYEQFF
jgi:hypothetical protein